MRPPTRAIAVAVALALTGVAVGARAACPPVPADGAVIAGAGAQLAWRVDGEAPIAVGRHFALVVQVCPSGARLVRVDATMPEHRHGMNYRPTLSALGDGRWRAEGLMFHMAGRWELRFDLDDGAGGRRDSLRADVVLR